MSVYRKDYIVFGWKLPYDISNGEGKIDFYSDKFLPMIEGHRGEDFSIIRDGMCGEYNVFGLVIESDDDRWDFIELDSERLIDIKLNTERVKSRYRELFGMDAVSEPSLFIFSHFS
jgi:hypothetical protein